MRAWGILFPDALWAHSLTIHEQSVPIPRFLVAELLTNGSDHILATATESRRYVLSLHRICHSVVEYSIEFH
jgi:hypothetical protein